MPSCRYPDGMSTPLRLTVGNIKGGVAKTTTAVYLALFLAAAHPTERVLLIDADPEQASALAWSEAASVDWPANLTAVAVATRDLARRVAGLALGYQHLIIDTSPKNPALLRQALLATDELLVPAAPRPMELRELRATFDLAAEVDQLHALVVSVLLVQVRTGTRSSREARDVLIEMGLPVLTAETHMREQYSLAFGTVPADLAEYSAVMTELRQGGMTA